MTDLVYLHNPRCRKSREGLELLRARGVAPTVREYLKDPLSLEEVKALAAALDADSLRGWLRTVEDAYKAQFAGKTPTLNTQIKAVAKEPKLLERPILIRTGEARVGRPPERLLDLV